MIWRLIYTAWLGCGQKNGVEKKKKRKKEKKKKRKSQKKSHSYILLGSYVCTRIRMGHSLFDRNPNPSTLYFFVFGWQF
jgi:hypothetical protein